MTTPLPSQVGRVLAHRDGSFYVQTPDALWSLVFARMKEQVRERETALTAWEACQPQGSRTELAYWERYRAEKAKHRVDYPMPWGHVMFDQKGGSR